MKALAYNVAALDKVLGLATQVGDSYKPGNASIERTALAALLEESRKSIAAVLKAEGDLIRAINERQHAFDALPLLGMQIMDMAEMCDMNQKDLNDLDKMRKHFRSQPFKGTALHSRSSGQVMPSETFGTQGEQQNASATSASSPEIPVRNNRQLSFGQKVVTLESIVQFLEGSASYTPTEPAFTIAGLKETLTALHAHNDAVTQAKSAFVTARAQANSMIFNRSTGVFGKARKAKKYLRTILGRNTDQYRSISKVKFKTNA